MAKELDFRTPLQRENAKRNAQILKEYQEIIKNPPENFTKWGAWRAIGEKYGLTPQGVRGILNKLQHSKKHE